MTIRQLRDLLATMHPDGEALVTLFHADGSAETFAIEDVTGIVNLMPEIARLCSKERTRHGFVLARAPVFSPLTHPQVSARERRLVVIFNKLTMP